MGLGLMLLLCLGGVGVFVAYYDGATEIKRTAPDAVVDSFIRGYLVNRSDNEVALYACKSGADFSQLASLRDEIVSREKNFNVKVNVTWSTLIVSGSGKDRRSVATNLTIAGTSGGETRSRHTESWTFGVIDDDGWRVCSAMKVA